jgi:tetratricopeptide (TPR) repeat protein
VIGGGPGGSFGRVFASRGKALVAKAFLRRGDQEIPLGENAGGGDVIYEAAPGEGDFRDLTLHLELDFFGQPWPLDFDLSVSEYARKLHRAKRHVAAAQTAAAARSDDPAAWIAWGDALQETGQLTAAREKYEKALALQPDDIDLWFAMAHMYVSRNLSEPAREVLHAAVEANPDDVELWSAWADEYYWSYAYPEAADIYGRTASLDPENLRWTWWQAASLFLAGEYDAAGALLQSFPEDSRSPRIEMMLYVTNGLADGGDPAAAGKAYLAFLQGLAEEARDPLIEGIVTSKGEAIGEIYESEKPELSWEQRCRGSLHAAYGYLIAGDEKRTRAFFTEAVETCAVDRMEYRFAKAGLGRM